MSIVAREQGVQMSGSMYFIVKILFCCFVMWLIIYKEMFLGCDWLIRVQLIPNITQNSAKICKTVQKSVTTTELYYWRTCSYLPSVKQVKPKKWLILVLADAISMTTGPLFSCELPLTNRDPNDFTDAFPSRKQV